MGVGGRWKWWEGIWNVFVTLESIQFFPESLLLIHAWLEHWAFSCFDTYPKIPKDFAMAFLVFRAFSICRPGAISPVVILGSQCSETCLCTLPDFSIAARIDAYKCCGWKYYTVTVLFCRSEIRLSCKTLKSGCWQGGTLRRFCRKWHRYFFFF